MLLRTSALIDATLRLQDKATLSKIPGSTTDCNCITNTHLCHRFLQDFLKEVDIRFMDQLRRGASIVATDLARAPPPATLRECYQLMCLTVPEVDQIEASISTIKEEIDMRKAAVADKEALLANHNPPVFQAVQVCPANHARSSHHIIICDHVL